MVDITMPDYSTTIVFCAASDFAIVVRGTAYASANMLFRFPETLRIIAKQYSPPSSYFGEVFDKSILRYHCTIL